MSDPETRESLQEIAEDINTHVQALWAFFDEGRANEERAFNSIATLFDLYCELRRYESRQRHDS